jgi:RHS repeat-associated protein
MNNNSITENYTYDNLDRLEGSNSGDDIDWNETLGSAAYGHISKKDSVGTYYYTSPGNQCDAVSQINVDLSGQDAQIGINEEEQTLTYNSFNSVKTIEEGNKRKTFYYGHDGQRTMMVSEIYYESTDTWDIEEYKYYLDGFEYTDQSTDAYTTVKEVTYVSGSAANIFLKEGTTGNEETEEQLYYVLSDHLGSITQLLYYDANGDLQTRGRFGYDAWGRLREVDGLGSWTYDISTSTQVAFGLLDRGYTGHEHLLDHQIINMNGRIYDPLTGAFMQPDNHIQTPEDFIGYDRYTYCRGNPFRYVDPSGEVAEREGPRVGFRLGLSSFATGILGDVSLTDGGFYEGNSLAYWGDNAIDDSGSIYDDIVAAIVSEALANIPQIGRGGGGGSSKPSLLKRVFSSVGGFFSGLFSGNDEKDAGGGISTGVRAMSDDAKKAMDDAFVEGGIHLNWSEKSEKDGSYTLKGYKPIEGMSADKKMSNRLNNIIESKVSIDIRMAPMGMRGSWFITSGSYNTSRPTVFINNENPGYASEFAGTTTIAIDWCKKFPFFAWSSPDFSTTPNSVSEAVIHEFLGHGHQLAKGRYSRITDSRSETDAVNFTNYYRNEYLSKPIRIYYTDKIPLRFPGAYTSPLEKYYP